ncbi:MAG: hypothetical protein NC320_00815 [Clostridium sp.]|nr:hypothetical protein [Clostridium sp.]MCM1546804.1 hypothetical protein [Ruminococcus sp.]
MKIDFTTEIIDKYMRESSVDPDREARIINLGEITNIFSIGTDNSLYLTKENESGEKSRFSRVKLLDNVRSFAAEKLDDRMIALGIISDDDVYITYTEDPEEITFESLYKLDFKGVLGGIRLSPYRVLMTFLGSSVSMFVEFHDDSGFTQQFAAVLDGTDNSKAKYFRLPSEFTEVTGIAAGRAARQLVDGTYTYGVFHAGNDSPYSGYNSDAPQLIYTPCRNPFGNTPPAPIRLKAESNIEAICTLKTSDDNRSGTHLFAVGEGKLYFYPQSEQLDWIQSDGKGVPKVAAESENLLNAKQMAAYILSNRLYIFIRTAGGELNYTVSDYDDNKPGKFLEPVNLMTDVVRFDINDGKITVFTKNEFIECTHNELTGSFSTDTVSIGTELDSNICFSAYSTRINVGKSDAEVKLESANGNKIGFYSGGYYYKTKKAVLKSDSFGYVTVLQKAADISPECYSITCGSETIDVNPADLVHKKLLSMTDENDFKNAKITDIFGETSPLAETKNSSYLSAAASGMAALHNSAIGLIPGMNNPITKFTNGVIMTITEKAISILPASLTDNPFTKFVADVVNDITAAFKWVIGKVKELYDKTVGKVINLVIQKTKKVWKLFIEIGGKVINVALDCAEKVIEGVKNLLETIGIPVGKIIDFFKKALGLDNAGRINSAIKNMAGISIDFLIEQASGLEESSIGFLSEAVDRIENWAGIDSEKLNSITLPSPSDNSGSMLSDMGISLDSHNMYAFDLISDAITPEIVTPEVKVTDGLEKAAKKLAEDIRGIGEEIEKIPGSLAYIADQVQQMFRNFNAQSLISVIKKILGVVAVDFLNISKAILKTILDIIIEGIRAVWEALSSPIQIPFLSGVLKIFGISEFSMVDILTYPTAFLANIINSVGKAVSGKELFDMDSIDEIANVKSLEELRRIGEEAYV